MNKNKKLRVIAAAAAIAVAGAVTVYAAYDSSKDPLVSLSYLGDVFKPEVKNELKSELKGELSSELNSSVSSMKNSIKEELKSDIYDQIAEDYSANIDALQKQVDALSNEYEIVTMLKGQKLTAGAACEIVIFSGSATVRCSATDKGLIDCTDGVILYDGQNAPQNHKLLVPDNGDGRGITATASAEILVKGGYTIG